MRARDAAIAVPVARILAAHGRASIKAVARDVGISPRQLERSFRRHVGVSPKMLSRIVRFQHVLRSQPERRTAPAAGNVPPGPESWADVAAACGYTDQSHLIRDVVQFAGESPTALAASEHAVADYFRRR
jgi:AraC-like DNA-binding protein